MKRIIAGGFGIITVVGIIALFMYNKPHKNISKTTPDYVLSATELSQKFNADETKANESYLGKVLEVSGKVVSDEMSSSNQRTIMLEGEGFVNIQCSLPQDDSNKIITYTKGNIITLKGVCTGMLLDVIVNDCVIIKQK